MLGTKFLSDHVQAFFFDSEGDKIWLLFADGLLR